MFFSFHKSQVYFFGSSDWRQKYSKHKIASIVHLNKKSINITYTFDS